MRNPRRVDHVTGHPHRLARREQGPVKVADQHPTGNAVTRFNTALALGITKVVGSMWCAYGFALFDLLSLKTAIDGGIGTIVAWIAQTFLQLVLLSIIMVGQNVQGAASDARAKQTYDDVELLLHELDQITALITRQSAQTPQTFGESDDVHGPDRHLRWSEPAGVDSDPDPHGQAGTAPKPEGHGTGPGPVA
jgi:hypothetical protein